MRHVKLARKLPNPEEWMRNCGHLGMASRWSQRVTTTSNALDLEPGVFAMRSSRRIAESLKRSAEQSKRRKGAPFQSAMSMLTFYINRAGTQLTSARKRILNDAKDELRRLYGKTKAA